MRQLGRARGHFERYTVCDLQYRMISFFGALMVIQEVGHCLFPYRLLPKS